MLMAVNYCEKCKALLEHIHLWHRYDENNSAVLPKEYCPNCHTVELTGDDIDFFIFGEKQ